MSSTPQPAASLVTDDRTYCTIHPTVETSLRCNKCGRYMCMRCAVHTPVGYRCKQCVHQQQDVYFTASQSDYLIATAVSFGLALPISFLLPKLFLIGVIILSLPAGAFIGEVASRAIGRRRGRYIWIAAAGAVTLAALVTSFSLIQAIIVIASDPRGVRASGELLLALLSPALYVVLCVGGVIARLRYGK